MPRPGLRPGHRRVGSSPARGAQPGEPLPPVARLERQVEAAALVREDEVPVGRPQLPPVQAYDGGGGAVHDEVELLPDELGVAVSLDSGPQLDLAAAPRHAEGGPDATP